MPNDSVVQLRGVRKSCNVGRPTEIEVLHGIDCRCSAASSVP